MPLFHKDETGSFVPFTATHFPDLETVLEDMVEANPHILLEGEEIAIFARQRSKRSRSADATRLPK